MRIASATKIAPRQIGSTTERDRDAPRPALRPPVRPLDDETTELIRVIQFVLPAGRGCQPVLWLERHLLD